MNRITTRKTIAGRVFRWLSVRWLLWHAAMIKDERQRYELAGAVGPEYARNSIERELQLRMRARKLEQQ